MAPPGRVQGIGAGCRIVKGANGHLRARLQLLQAPARNLFLFPFFFKLFPFVDPSICKQGARDGP